MIVVLVALLLLASAVAVYYYSAFRQEKAQNQVYVVQLMQLGVGYSSHILIDFGNGTRTWYNGTRFQPGWNLYVATQVITSGLLNATYYPEYGSHFVTAIDGVGNTKTSFWLLWTYNATTSWQMSQVGPDQLTVFNGSVYAWTYSSCTSNCPLP